MTDNQLNEIEDFGLKLIREIGDFAAIQRSSGEIQVNYKGSDLNLVTNVDLACDRAINDAVLRRFPEHRILSEESEHTVLASKEQLNGPLWIVDPIDGTTNFAHRIPFYAVSIAFALEGQVQWGAVFAPELGQLFAARRGRGATCNGKPISPGNPKSLKQALVATGFPYERANTGGLAATVEAVLTNCRDIRRCGACSIDVCWVASGRIDAYYETVMPWDIAAARLIATEAGAKATNLMPAPSNIASPCSDFESQLRSLPCELSGKQVVISTPAIYEPFIELLRSVWL